MSQKPHIVAREAEFGRLNSLLERALARHGQLCFVTGDAGSGKTSLLAAFAERAQARHRELVVATGISDAQTGIGDAYLPFREVLQLLTGDVEAKLAEGRISGENADRLKRLVILAGETLVEMGPDLIGILVPGATLLAKAGTFMAGKSRWADTLRQRLEAKRGTGQEPIEQSQIFEQYVNVLRKLSVQAPLTVILDDLQWADAASLGLLFRLGRRLEGSRILVIGLYRPNDLAQGRNGERHPLEPIVSELKRYLGDIEIDLDQAREERGREFINAYLDRELNRLGEAFRAALHHHTGGHPLFAVELLRNLQERGDLVQDFEGFWTQSPRLEWTLLPSRVEGVIEERIGRLADDLKRSLAIASVEGEQFTAEVVSQVQPIEVRELVRRLSETLQKQHRLVKSQGVERLRQQRLSYYRFSHNLMQSYLYHHLDAVEAAFLHEDVGRALEELYGDQADTVAVHLARHFEAANLPDKARYYLQKAGKRAAASYANQEAIGFFSRALELTPEDDFEGRLWLLLAREKIYDHQGARAAQLADLEALEVLVERLDDSSQRTEVALRRAAYECEVGNYPTSLTLAESVVAAAQAAADAEREAHAHGLCGRVLRQQAKYAEARVHLEQGLAQARTAQLPATEASCLRSLGIVADLSGDRHLARSCFEQALEACRRMGYRTDEARSLSNLGVSVWRAGDFAEAQALFEQAVQINREVGARVNEGVALNNLAMVMLSRKEFSQARRYTEEALIVNREVGSPYNVARTLGILSVVVWKEGDILAAKKANEEALALDRQVGDRQDEALRLSNLGILAAQLGQHDEARIHYEAALQLSEEIKDRDIEMASLRDMALLFLQLEDYQAARNCSVRALQLAQDLEDRQGLARCCVSLGHSHLALGEMSDAKTSYEYALSYLANETAFDARAGLARVALAQGDISAALLQLEPILEQALTGSLEGADERFRVYLTCYQVLRVAEDPRTKPLLQQAQADLKAFAEKISDEALQRSFLENVPIHRELMVKVVDFSSL